MLVPADTEAPGHPTDLVPCHIPLPEVVKVGWLDSAQIIMLNLQQY